ncbi:MAG: hypothetical protein ACE5I3_15545 [Phycisphaerae bacterium]
MLLSDNFKSNDVGDFDNFGVIPERGSFALLALGVLAVQRRR